MAHRERIPRPDRAEMERIQEILWQVKRDADVETLQELAQTKLAHQVLEEGLAARDKS